MKILFVCRSFHNMAGGVERQSSLLMNYLVSQKISVSLVTWDLENPNPFYEIDKRVKWNCLNIGDHNLKASFFVKIKRLIKLRSIFNNEKPDLCIAYQHGSFLTFKVATLGLGSKVISAERNSPTRMLYISEGKKQKFVYNTMRFAEAVTVQFERYREIYPDYLADKIISIPNPVDVDVPRCNIFGKNTILAVGRLEFQKNFSVLIKAFGKIAKNHPKWRLIIAGDGGQKKMLEVIIRDYKIEEQVDIIPPDKNIENLYNKASFICMPSFWEGFPNVLAEGMARGIPACGFQECCGVRDLIIDGQTGLLAEGIDNTNSLAETLERMIKSEVMQQKYSDASIKEIHQYSNEKIMKTWKNELESLVEK